MSTKDPLAENNNKRIDLESNKQNGGNGVDTEQIEGGGKYLLAKSSTLFHAI